MDKQDTASRRLGSKRTCAASDADSVVYGEYTAGGTMCAESAINNVVARVHLDSLDLHEYFANKTKKMGSANDVKKGVKRKLLESPSADMDSKNDVEIQLKKKGRGRPKKIQEPVTVIKPKADSQTYPTPVRKRGRPRKTGATVEESTSKETNNISFKSKLKSNFNSLKIKNNLFKLQHVKRFNGDKNAGIVATNTTRVRKPNSRFQDFVVSPNIRYIVPSGAASPLKEKPLPIKIKPKPKSPKPVETTNTAEDPLALSSSDEVVHSFLPIFDEPPRLDNVLILKNNKGANDAVEQLGLANKKFKEKENQVNNLQPKIAKSTPKPEVQELPKNDYSPPKLRSRSNSKPSTPTLKTPKIKAIKVVDNNYKLPKERQSPAVNSNPTTPQKKPKLKDAESGLQKSVAVAQNNNMAKVLSNALKSKTKVNGSNDIKQKKKASYVLVESDCSHRTKVPKLSDVDFNKLVRSLKSVKLPAANWKIRIVVSRQQTITEVTFTNKEVNERCVKFSRLFTGYIITFGKAVVKLLGAPSKISSFNDVTVLLDIIHNVASSDPVLEYSADTDV